MCESCIRKGMGFFNRKIKIPALEKKEITGNKKCLLLKDPCSLRRELSGKMFTSVCFSHGNFNDEIVKQDLILPGFYANDELYYFHIDEL